MSRDLDELSAEIRASLQAGQKTSTAPKLISTFLLKGGSEREALNMLLVWAFKMAGGR